MTDWMGLFPEEMREVLTGRGESAFRAEQIFAWMSKGVGFDGMTNLPKKLREDLGASWRYPAEIVREEASSDGDTVKMLFALNDGNVVEGVLLRYHHGNTLCVSTQVGCRMGCAFCASTIDGRARDITAAEMLAMTALVNAKYASGDKRGITNIVLMGSGEPLDNYDHTLRFVRLAAHPKGMGISPRNVSLSTCGLVEGIERLTREGLHMTLSLSLHAPNDEIRKQILPIAAKYAIDDVLAACRRYVQATGRRMIVEYTVIRGLNDGAGHARELAERLKGLMCHVNLIPLNPVKERPEFLPPTEKGVYAFAGVLEEGGITATVRRTLGGDVQGACGQLRRSHLREMDEDGEEADSPEEG